VSESVANTQPFNRYARYYDLLYQDKDYAAECGFLEHTFNKFQAKPVKTVLDAGCGTGQHAILLARKGYMVEGVDASPVAIDLARRKGALERVAPTFRTADIRDLRLDGSFDACIAMFAVMNYLTSNEDIYRALSSIRKHLAKGSLLIFDCWNGLAVLRTLPSVKLKKAVSGKTSVLRIAQPELDAVNHICRVNYDVLILEDDRVVERVCEVHTIRFLFPQEIAHYLTDAGFDLVTMCPFPYLEGEVNENVWNITVVARVRG